MRYFLLLFLSSFLLLNTLSAQEFGDWFENKTLRLDYAFEGDSGSQSVALDRMSQLPQWAGRIVNLSSLGRMGNGQIIVSDAETGKVIYKDSFSTLFQEWQTTDEAKVTKRSFENVLLVPFPKKKVKIEIKLRLPSGVYESALTHIVDPNDILIKKAGTFHKPTYSFVHRADTTRAAIHVVFVAEGYTADEMAKFREHAAVACQAILAHQVFGKYKDRFNFIAVETVSKNTGVSVPRTGEWRETAFGSHFDTFYSDRYLTTSNMKDVHNAIAGIPYAHIIILANTNVYGGGGIFNAYTLTTTGHAGFKPVVVHEFGHSFGGLGDEYYYQGGDALDNTYSLTVEPWEPNITTLVDFTSKWESLLAPHTPVPTPADQLSAYPIGVFEGGGYKTKGVYRSASDCRMKTNTCDDFCPACQNALEQLIKFYTE